MIKKEKPVVLVVVGPTASGKTKLGIELAKAFNGEIISADSMQIYRELDVGTAKPTKEEQDVVAHHLIDICDITDKFSAKEYKELCYKKIDELVKKNITPIIVGGTGLYVNAVINNMSFDDVQKDDEDIRKSRQELEKLLNEKGNEYLYNMLVSMDPEAANKIHANNTKRVIRALEILKEGSMKSDIEKRNDLWNRNESPYRFVTIYIDMPRELLYQRINFRVDKMVEEGIVEEANKLKQKKLPTDNTAIQAIGYKEFFNYIDNTETLDIAVDKLKQATRRYAKRQITWFKKLNCDILLSEGMTQEELIFEIKRMLNEKK